MNEKDQTTIIALLGKDIQYIKDELSEIRTTLKVLLDHYVKREEFEVRLDKMQTDINSKINSKECEAKFERLQSGIKDKVDSKDFDPFVKLFWNVVTWAVICIIGAALTGAGIITYLN